MTNREDQLFEELLTTTREAVAQTKEALAVCAKWREDCYALAEELERVRYDRDCLRTAADNAFADGYSAGRYANTGLQ